MKYFTEKEIIEIGCFMMNRPVLEEWEKFKKTVDFQDHTFILTAFTRYLGFTEIETSNAIMQKTEQIEDYNQIFKYV